jgi:hypothetical protein
MIESYKRLVEIIGDRVRNAASEAMNPELFLRVAESFSGPFQLKQTDGAMR